MFIDARPGAPGAELALEHLMERLADSVLEMSESQTLREAREEGEDPSQLARKTRALLWAQVKNARRARLEEAMDEYRRQVAKLKDRRFGLPATAEGRRELMASLFQRYPQIQSAFLTVQHREFKSLSDRDVESFLKQLQILGALPEEAPQKELGKAGAKEAGAQKRGSGKTDECDETDGKG